MKPRIAAALALGLAAAFAMSGVTGNLPAMAETVHSGGGGNTGLSLSDAGIDPGANGTLTISINNDEWYVEGTTFRLYKVASLDDALTNGAPTFTYTDKFQTLNDVTNRSRNIRIQPLAPSVSASSSGSEAQTAAAKATASQWMDAAGKLIQFVRDNEIAEDETVVMQNRQCSFDSLGLGLYLVQGDTGRTDSRTVTYQPILICIPQNYNVNNSGQVSSWTYDVRSYVKSASPENTTPEEPDHPDNPTPDNPNEPDNPTPDNPDEPDNPTPDNPDEPDNPTPDHPDNPGTPEHHHHHDNPGDGSSTPDNGSSTPDDGSSTESSTESTTETTESTTESSTESTSEGSSESSGGSSGSSSEGSSGSVRAGNRNRASDDDESGSVKGSWRNRAGDDAGSGSVKGSSRNSHTGDDSALPVYLGIMGAAAAILVIYFLLMNHFRKKRDDDTDASEGQGQK